MKNWLIIGCLLISSSIFAQNTSTVHDQITAKRNLNVGTSTVLPSAVVNVASTTKGVLFPRMNTTQQYAINSPVMGLMIYNTDSLALFTYNGSVWRNAGQAGGGVGSSNWNVSGSNVYRSSGNVGINSSAPQSRLHIKTDNIGIVQTDSTGIFLENSTAATVGANKQYSPAIVWKGSAYRSSGTVSQDHLYRLSVKTVSATVVPSASYWTLENNAYGSGYFDLLKVLGSPTGSSLSLLSPDGSFGIINNVPMGYSQGTFFYGTKPSTLRTGVANVSFGGGALQNSISGNYNTAIGNSTLITDTSIGFNTAVGFASLAENTSGYSNSGFGVNALRFNSTGIKNTSIGAGAHEANTTGSFNTMVGQDASYQSTIGSYNSGLGYVVFNNLTTGGDNTGIGYRAGGTVTTGSSNTFLGYGSGFNGSQKIDAFNSIAIGRDSYTTEDSSAVLGASFIKKTTLRGLINAAGIPFASATNRFLMINGSGDIVQADTAGFGGGGSGHNPVTLAGEDYLSLSGQQITANKVSMATNVSGTLSVANGGTGQAAWASGDMPYKAVGGSPNFLSRLVIGSEGQVLKVASGIPSWQNESAGGITNVLGVTNRTSVTGTTTKTVDINPVFEDSINARLNRAIHDSSGIFKNGTEAVGYYPLLSSPSYGLFNLRSLKPGTNASMTLDGDSGYIIHMNGLIPANNLADVTNVTTARNNILPSKAGNSLKYLRVNAGETDYELATIAGGGDMLKSENLSGLANYTTARSNLGLVIGTDVLAPTGSAASLTSFPTLNQNTTGSAATLTTARTINGVAFNGSANISVPSNITPGTTGNVLTSNGTGWTSAAPTGNVTKVGTPVNNQIGVWTGDGTIEGDANFTWQGTGTKYLFVNGSVNNQLGAAGAFRIYSDTYTDGIVEVFAPSTGATINVGDFNFNVNGNYMQINDEIGKAYFTNTNTNIKLGINQEDPTVALDVVGDVKISGYANIPTTYNVQTGTTYTLLASDNNKVVTLNNAGAITLTVPASLPTGFNCSIVQLGAGVVTVTASGTTINNRQGFTQTKGQYAALTILQYATNTFVTQGDMQ